MGMRRNRHIPDRDYEHDCGHEFYYNREEREALPNAVKRKKPAGLRRFMILFFDLILVIGGVTVIRSCLVGKEKKATRLKSSSRGAIYGSFIAVTTIEKGRGGREYRLTLKKRDRTLFSLNTNAISVGIQLQLNGKRTFLKARTLAADEKLISHQFFTSVKEESMPSESAVFLWRVATNRVIRITNRP